jgi:hypothetical protein
MVVGTAGLTTTGGAVVDVDAVGDAKVTTVGERDEITTAGSRLGEVDIDQTAVPTVRAVSIAIGTQDLHGLTSTLPGYACHTRGRHWLPIARFGVPTASVVEALGEHTRTELPKLRVPNRSLCLTP